MSNKFIVTPLALGSWPRLGLAKVRAKSQAWESHFMFPGVWESVREWTPTLPSELPFWELESQWTPKFSEGGSRGQNSLDWRFLYIIGKLSKRRCLKWAHMTHLGTYKVLVLFCVFGCYYLCFIKLQLFLLHRIAIVDVVMAPITVWHCYCCFIDTIFGTSLFCYCWLTVVVVFEFHCNLHSFHLCYSCSCIAIVPTLLIILCHGYWWWPHCWYVSLFLLFFCVV